MLLIIFPGKAGASSYESVRVQGSVLEDGGGPPPDIALVQAVCNGVVRAESYTDPKGRFTMKVDAPGHGPRSWGSADNRSGDDGFAGPSAFNRDVRGAMEFDLRAVVNCGIRALLAGYSSESIDLAHHNSLSNPDIGAIRVRRLGKVEGRIVSATSLSAPKAARKAYEKGVAEFRRDKLETAHKELSHAVSVHPEYAAAWSELGLVRAALNDADGARAAFEAAVRSDSRYLPPHLYLAELQAGVQQWQLLDATTSQVIQLDPFDYPKAYLMNAIAKYNLKDIRGAEKSLRTAQVIDTEYSSPQSWHLMGIVLAVLGDYAGAAAQFEEYLRVAPASPNAAEVKAQLSECRRKAGSAPVAMEQSAN